MDDPRFKHVASDPRFKVRSCMKRHSYLPGGECVNRPSLSNPERSPLTSGSSPCLQMTASRSSVSCTESCDESCDAGMHADKVDKRGRKVEQTSGEDLRKYYELGGLFMCLFVCEGVTVGHV